jgi:hypothetical protein
MSLSPVIHLGPYVIATAIGVGGMGWAESIAHATCGLSAMSPLKVIPLAFGAFGMINHQSLRG